MEVVVQTRHPEAQALRGFAETRVRLATQRLSGFVSRAVVRLRDMNGPRGGVDKQCQIQISTTEGQVLLVSSRGTDWRTTLDAALERVGHTLAKRFNARKPKSGAKPGVLAAQEVAAH